MTETASNRIQADGVLVLYHYPARRNAATIMENINAFEQYSAYNVWKVNTAFGFPKGLGKISFRVIVFHYSIVGRGRCRFDREFADYVDSCRDSHKIAFFQDEYHYCKHRFAFVEQYGINCIYTLLEPQHFDDVYGKYTSVKNIIHHLPGYVGDDLVKAAEKYTLAAGAREVDVGYRGRELPPYMGRGAQEKTGIAREFVSRAGGLGLTLDIETNERKRIYKDNWYKFVARCRAVLGVETGVSIFDIDDVVREKYERMVAANPRVGFDEVSAALLAPWEDNIYYRTIGPRHFEGAALRVCQILFEGKYSGAMQPMEHYIPLKKDFSNFDDVIEMFKDESLRRRLVDNAHRDLIASGQYSYKRFISGFDAELDSVGIERKMAPDDVEKVTAIVSRREPLRYVRAYTKSFVLYGEFPGRRIVEAVARPLWNKRHKRATVAD